MSEITATRRSIRLDRIEAGGSVEAGDQSGQDAGDQSGEERASLDFLGYTFRWNRDRYGRNRRYLHAGPSKKALQQERDKLTAMTDSHQCHKPIPELIEGLNRQLKGWGNYFKLGYPRDAFRAINWHLGQRLFRHLNRRSQRAFRLPEGSTYYEHFRRLGLKPLEI
jgi:RNA-directed DNA polymerase